MSATLAGVLIGARNPRYEVVYETRED